MNDIQKEGIGLPPTQNPAYLETTYNPYYRAYELQYDLPLDEQVKLREELLRKHRELSIELQGLPVEHIERQSKKAFVLRMIEKDPNNKILQEYVVTCWGLTCIDLLRLYKMGVIADQSAGYFASSKEDATSISLVNGYLRWVGFKSEEVEDDSTLLSASPYAMLIAVNGQSLRSEAGVPIHVWMTSYRKVINIVRAKNLELTNLQITILTFYEWVSKDRNNGEQRKTKVPDINSVLAEIDAFIKYLYDYPLINNNHLQQMIKEGIWKIPSELFRVSNYTLSRRGQVVRRFNQLFTLIDNYHHVFGYGHLETATRYFSPYDKSGDPEYTNDWSEVIALEEESVFDQAARSTARESVLVFFNDSDLTQKQKYVLACSYGLFGMPEKTAKEIGEDLGLTKDEVAATKNQALTRLRHPTKSSVLKEFLDAFN